MMCDFIKYFFFFDCKQPKSISLVICSNIRTAQSTSNSLIP